MTTRQEDLTGRARIRDAALAEFAARGVRGATVRGIAARAGVSPALVQHHFGTKERLREACDAHVLDFVRDGTTAALEEGRVGDADYLAELLRSAPNVQRYLARALVDGSPAAARLFDDFVAFTANYLAPEGEAAGDVGDRALVLTAMRFGVLVLHEHVSRGLGTDVFGPDALVRVARASLDVLNPDLLPAGTVTAARAGLDEYQKRRGTR